MGCGTFVSPSNSCLILKNRSAQNKLKRSMTPFTALFRRPGQGGVYSLVIIWRQDCASRLREYSCNFIIVFKPCKIYETPRDLSHVHERRRQNPRRSMGEASGARALW